MGKTYRGEQRDQFKGRNKSKNHSKKNQKKAWKETNGDYEEAGRNEQQDNWDR